VVQDAGAAVAQLGDTRVLAGERGPVSVLSERG